MAVTGLSFESQIANFCDVAKSRALAVAHGSAIEAAETMQRIGPSVGRQKRADARGNPKRMRPTFDPGQGGNMPVLTGWLRASSRATTSGPVPMDTMGEQTGKFTYRYDRRKVDRAIRKAKLGDTIYLSYGARYAGHQEYGANGRPGRGFVRLAAQNWIPIVRRVLARVRSGAANVDG